MKTRLMLMFVLLIPASSIGQDPAAAIRSRESIGAAQTTAARYEPKESFSRL
jgi:hypothetical protein